MITINLVGAGSPTTVRLDDKTGQQAGGFANLLRRAETQMPGRGDAAVQAFNIRTFGPTIGAAVNAQGYVAIDQIRIAYEEKLAGFKTELGNLFRDEEIKTTPAPMLEIDKKGKVTVINDHPDKKKIEKLFAEHGDLAQRFASLQSDATVIQAYDKSADKRSVDWRLIFDGERMRLESSSDAAGRFAWSSAGQSTPEGAARAGDQSGDKSAVSPVL